MEEIEFILDSAKEQMDGAIKHLEISFSKIRAGKASPQMLDNVSIDYYGAITPLSQASNINTPDARTISVQPWDKSMLEVMEKAIIDANLGFNPMNNGEMIIINVPPLTEERRIQLVKQAKSESENAKVSIRNARKDANDELKKLSGISEDVLKDSEAEVQNITNEFVAKIDAFFSNKEQEILTV
ncbi:MAG: ribosome recycling factor [Flavobacteriales bacterium]|jgi:ribosome recycling factor|nr:ribosome recycling factor [Flavobacteriales bacterium]|tara:strand:- start:3066 stop:3620 length:555 start_codon:yes stop_codon:yes gene_type:complete